MSNRYLIIAHICERGEQQPPYAFTLGGLVSARTVPDSVRYARKKLSVSGAQSTEQ
jgi:hypothetical protein